MNAQLSKTSQSINSLDHWALIIVNKKGEVLRFNEEASVMYEQQSLLLEPGMTIDELVVQEQVDLFSQELLAACSSQCYETQGVYLFEGFSSPFITRFVSIKPEEVALAFMPVAAKKGSGGINGPKKLSPQELKSWAAFIKCLPALLWQTQPMAPIKALRHSLTNNLTYELSPEQIAMLNAAQNVPSSQRQRKALKIAMPATWQRLRPARLGLR